MGTESKDYVEDMDNDVFQPQGTRFLSSNQGLGGDFVRCSIGSFLGRNGRK